MPSAACSPTSSSPATRRCATAGTAARSTSSNGACSRHRGEEYLLERRLAYRLSTGEVVGSFVTDFVYPNRHRYSALAALDHFRDAALQAGTPPDPRLAEAIEMVRAARHADGTWHQGRTLEGRRWFDIDAPEGQPSRWLTFLALRVLQWWDAAR